MKTIHFNSCKECPFSESNHCGKKRTCNHPKVMTIKPYAKDREVGSSDRTEGEAFPDFCPIPNLDCEIWTFEQFVEYGKSVSDNIVEGMPWSFTFKGFAVSHENNDLYIITTPVSTIHFRSDWTLICRNKDIVVI